MMMLCSLLFLLLMCCDGGAAVLHTRQWQLTDVPCSVVSLDDTLLVRAQLEKPIKVDSCWTNTAPTSHEIHIIQYHGQANDDVQITLLDDKHDDIQHQFTVILVSDVKVYWQVKMKAPIHNNQTFVVSKGSGLRFTKKKMSNKPTITKPQIPYETGELQDWARKRYGGFTSFNVLPGGNMINLHIGKVPVPDMALTCDLHSNSNSSNVKVISLATQPVQGCLQPRKQSSENKPAYVIELQNVQTKEEFEVNLEIRCQSCQSKDKEFALVLKSPPNVSWNVHTKKVQGYIYIVANEHVDMSGIRMQTVSVRSESLPVSGMMLLRWVEYFLGPVSLYVTMNDTSHIDITLPDIDELAPPALPSNNATRMKHVKEVLSRSLTKTCDQNSLTVAVDKDTLQLLGIRVSSLTLQDESCRGIENSTHVYIRSRKNTCATSVIEAQPGLKTYINKLIVHSRLEILEGDDDMLEGSGMDVFSGSGENDVGEVTMDDEDLQLHHVTIDVRCMVNNLSPPTVPPPHDMPTFQLHLFNNPLFQGPFNKFPVKVEKPYTHLYLQSLATAEPYLRSHMKHCWLSPGLKTPQNKYTLVEHGCAQESSVQYLSNGIPQSEILRFTLEYYMAEAVTDRVELTCELTLCCISLDCGKYKYPQCPRPDGECTGSHERHTRINTHIPTETVILGSLILPDKVTTYDDSKDPFIKTLSEDTETSKKAGKSDPVIIEGLDSSTVVGIAFAAFVIGVLMMASLWYIHTHSRSFCSKGPIKRPTHVPVETEDNYVESTPGSSAPISIRVASL